VTDQPDLPHQRSYYDRLWAETPAAKLNLHERARREVIEHTLEWLSSREPPPWSIAEAGCGRGWLSGLVLSSYGQVHAFDLSPDSIEKAREAFPHVRWELRDILEAPLPSTHDLVVSSEVIEHVIDHSLFVERLVSATRAGGWLLLTTPNATVAHEYQRQPGSRQQPIENLLETKALVDLLANTCDVVRAETFFFGSVNGPLQRLTRLRAVCALRHRSHGRDPLTRMFSRARLGLYTLVLARRRT
jgi:2-polyprenyl-3-methyl-5-hydroxy-6-metoxy-1,4-benzoquinol methylase